MAVVQAIEKHDIYDEGCIHQMQPGLTYKIQQQQQQKHQL